MSLYNKAIDCLAKSRGWSGDECAVLRAYAKQVAMVESNCKPKACQIGGGPGRGKYQFELMAGGSGAAAVARTRMMRFQYRHGIHFDFSPDDMAVLRSDDPDFSLLSEDAQDVLFVANADGHPHFKLNDLVKGKTAFVDAWIRYHWAGPEHQERARREHWHRVNGYASA